MKNFSIQTTWLSQLMSSFAAPLEPRDDGYGPLHFKASFGSSPSPMTIGVDPKFISQTKLKASLTRYPIDIDEPLFTEGVPNQNLSAIRDYWVDQYDWGSVQDGMNANFSHYTTTVGPLSSSSNYTKPIPLHFVHHRSPREDAIPLIFIHGWPGSFLEVTDLIEPLTNPPDDQPAFHVVAPSIPGFGFSPAPTSPGFGLIEAAAAFNELMLQLGYERYVSQGGDFGGHTSRYLGAMFPDNVVSILTNMYGVMPNATDLQRQQENKTTPEENAYIDFIRQSEGLYQAFWGIQYTVPLQMGILLGDSPVGNVVWPYLGMKGMAPGYEWTLDQLITWGMMLYIQGPYGNIRIYVELEKEGTLDFDFPYIPVPVGVLQYYGDADYGAPHDWCARSGNITYFKQKPKDVMGGHFPAVVNPSDLVNEIRSFWGSAAGGWST